MKFEIFDFAKYTNDKKIVIYGTGDMAFVTTYCLEQLGLPIYTYVNENGVYQAPFRNVISLLELVDICEKGDVLILWATNWNARVEVENFKKLGIEQVYSVRKIWEEVDFRESGYIGNYAELYVKRKEIFFIEDAIANPNKLFLYSLDATVTERCSLKCKSCSNLMQYYVHPKNLNIEELKNSIDYILDKAEQIYDLRILGGEPFMNMEFVKLLDAYADETKITKISIFTNATIFPKEDVLEHLKNRKIYMRISNYGELSRNLATWVKWCEENNVYYTVEKIEVWQDCGKLEKHSYSMEELLSLYGNCECRNLPTLIENKLFGCPYAANAANLGAMERKEMERDYLVVGENTTATEIDNFLYNRDYLEACRYCSGRNMKRARIEPFVQTKHPLEYKCLSEDIEEVQKCEVDSAKDEECVLLSVVVPVYNVEKYIESCLLSILEQTYQNLEIIVVDDGSMDSTLEICRRVQKEDTQERVKIFEIEHGGVVTARNIGIQNASGEYITFVDGDDYLAENRLENMVKAMRDCDMVSAGYINIYEHVSKEMPDILFDRGQSTRKIVEGLIPEGIYEGEKLLTFWKYSFYNAIYEQVNMTLWSKLCRTSIMKSICCEIDTSLFMGEDFALMHRYMLECKKIAVIKDYGYYYRVNNVRNKYFLVKDMEKIMDNLYKAFMYKRNIFKNHTNEKILMAGAEMEYARSVMMVLASMYDSENSMYTKWYYPYYGRLKGKKIILYGAGNVGKAYYHHMVNDAECILQAWVDKNAKYLKEIELLPVQDVGCICDYDYDYIVVAVNEEVRYMQIRNELVLCGVPEDKIIWNATKYAKLSWSESTW